MQWPESQEWRGGEIKTFQFENGYGASMVRFPGSYGYENSLWEIAVLSDGKICYDTPITDDVIGHLNDAEADAILEDIARLPSTKL
jgi:hypothetical protein